MRPCLGKIWRRQNNHFCFFCIEFEKVGLHPNLNFRYTILYWAKAGIIILTKWNIELCIICITVELHTKFSQNVIERKKICDIDLYREDNFHRFQAMRNGLIANTLQNYIYIFGALWMLGILHILMKHDVTYVTSPLIGWGFAHVTWDNT